MLHRLDYLLFLIICLYLYSPLTGTVMAEKKWTSTCSLGLAANSGNTDNLRLNAGFNLIYSEFDVAARLMYGESQGESDTDQGSLRITYDHYFLPKWKYFLFSTSEFDKLSSINMRLNGGVGIKYSFMKDDKNELSLSGAFLAEHEELLSADGHNLPSIRDKYRFSIRPKVEKALNDKSSFKFVLFYMPCLENLADDYRSEIISCLKTDIRKNIWLKIELFDRYTNLVPYGTKNNDLSLNTFLEFTI